MRAMGSQITGRQIDDKLGTTEKNPWKFIISIPQTTLLIFYSCDKFTKVKLR